MPAAPQAQPTPPPMAAAQLGELPPISIMPARVVTSNDGKRWVLQQILINLLMEENQVTMNARQMLVAAQEARTGIVTPAPSGLEIPRA